MKERIKEFINYKGIQAGELATLLEVQRSNISHILNGRNKPGASLIEKILLVFPELNARWLLTGKGDMLETAKNELISKELKKTIIPVKKEIVENKKVSKESQIDRVVLLFNDGTFESYNQNVR